MEEGMLEPVDPTPPLQGSGLGIRRVEGMVQLGLTNGEIGDIQGRLENLVKQLDQGKLEVF